ncbi:unnamed protein product [Didymodactylos carnosus]|uniref:Uncharacterized protein n=1 Tax=Didymodactylos carnosus TaxID=1234261 RepID=A0A8S2YN03_9BILA|nr:unnamed protein product [Didymodactylos carnosus]
MAGALSYQELEQIQSNNGGIISFNTFFSTTMSRDVALIYASHLDNSVLFEITIECNHVLIPYIKLNKN